MYFSLSLFLSRSRFFCRKCHFSGIALAFRFQFLVFLSLTYSRSVSLGFYGNWRLERLPNAEMKHVQLLEILMLSGIMDAFDVVRSPPTSMLYATFLAPFLLYLLHMHSFILYRCECIFNSFRHRFYIVDIIFGLNCKVYIKYIHTHLLIHINEFQLNRTIIVSRATFDTYNLYNFYFAFVCVCDSIVLFSIHFCIGLF